LVSCGMAQFQWTGLVNMPVGSTNFGFGFASTAGANINRGESATGTPAKKDRGAGFSQIGLDDKGGFANLDCIDEFTLSPEQIAAGIAAIADPGSINRDVGAPHPSHLTPHASRFVV
jgi:hypothetical protein